MKVTIAGTVSFSPDGEISPSVFPFSIQFKLSLVLEMNGSEINDSTGALESGGMGLTFV